MATTKAKPAKRMDVREVEDDVLATAHGLAMALHHAGALDAVDMRDLGRLCLPPRPDYGGPEIKRIRAATRMSQPVFARLLGVDKSAVAQWERGAKRPSGPALRLLEVLDPEKPDSPVVQVRRGIEKAT
ncbi:MAG: helix-turn-helix domain-containing protein [Acetobacteraceae bacterium]